MSQKKTEEEGGSRIRVIYGKYINSMSPVKIILDYNIILFGLPWRAG